MAATDSPVLLMGETGTGKELMAHALHQASRRADGPFIAINVAAMPENLLESELLVMRKALLQEQKREAVRDFLNLPTREPFFLDEVEGMSLSMQVKLLRVLQEGRSCV